LHPTAKIVHAAPLAEWLKRDWDEANLQSGNVDGNWLEGQERGSWTEGWKRNGKWKTGVPIEKRGKSQRQKSGDIGADSTFKEKPALECKRGLAKD